MLKLYHHPTSASSRYVRLLLGEYGASAEFTEEAPWSRREEFLALNPAGGLPVLVEAGADPICGGIVVGEFLDETRGAMMRERRLMPESPVVRAEVRRLVEWFLLKLDQEVNQYLVGERVHKLIMLPQEGGGAPDAGLIRAGRANLKHHLGYIGWLAASRNWLAGTKISNADIAAAAAMSVLDYLGEVNWADQPAAKDWYQRVKSRPSFRPLLEDRVRGLPPASHYIDLDF